MTCVTKQVVYIAVVRGSVVNWEYTCITLFMYERELFYTLQKQLFVTYIFVVVKQVVTSQSAFVVH